MLTVYATKHLTWENNTTSVNHYEMFADTLSDLPTDAYYFSTEQSLYKIAQGSVAWVIATAELYMFNSDGTWVLETTGGGAISTGDYENLANKPKINDVELDGNKTSSDLGLQSVLTFDSSPTNDSLNPVTSGGVYTALAGKADTTHNQASDTINALTGYTAPTNPTTWQTVSANDTLNDATQKIVNNEELNKTNISLIKQVPAVESTDDGKVLTASYSNNTGEYSWQPASGGGGNAPFIITVSGFDDGATVNKTSAEIIAAYNANPTDIIILIERFQNNDYIIRDIAFDNSGSNMSLYGTISKVDRVDSTYQLTNSTFRLELYPKYVSVTYKSIRLDCNSSDNSVAVGNYTEFPT